MKIPLTAAAIGLAVCAALCTPGVAGAIPTSDSAADVVEALHNQGYNVLFNSPSTMPLPACTVNGIHGLTVMMIPDGSLMLPTNPNTPGVVYVDLTCPDSNN
ncbi:hypothetical protein MycrhDRAFT_3997 [Mycolicibacterium rhodesiae JS60]|nr:hypothetical protein MycrhDRAFT_3997 [Mycolicibacterium rhodesiae JS60]